MSSPDAITFSDTEHTLNENRELSKRLKNKYPNRIPVLVKANNDTITLKKHKFLPIKDSTFGNFLYFIRQYVDLNSKQSIIAFANNTLVPVSSTLDELYQIHADADGFLYIYITKENTFGYINVNKFYG